MWSRRIIKSNAKLALGEGRYWTAFGAVVTVLVPTLVLAVVYQPFYDVFLQAALLEDIYAMTAASSALSVISSLSFFISIFVSYPLTIGMERFFIHNRFGDTNYGTVFNGFKRGYLNGIGTLFVTDLFIGLWSLLFIIPGVIKMLQYFFVPYIMADNPYLPGSRARQISRMMTQGEKGAIFVLGLSFFGWYLLAGLAAGVISFFIPSATVAALLSLLSTLFVAPYPQASQAELYIFLRDRAISSGMVDPAELCLTAPMEPPAI